MNGGSPLWVCVDISSTLSYDPVSNHHDTSLKTLDTRVSIARYMTPSTILLFQKTDGEEVMDIDLTVLKQRPMNDDMSTGTKADPTRKGLSILEVGIADPSCLLAETEACLQLHNARRSNIAALIAFTKDYCIQYQSESGFFEISDLIDDEQVFMANSLGPPQSDVKLPYTSLSERELKR
ncbi:hypothetical protein SCUP515_01401 [Seiridium cupressi]